MAEKVVMPKLGATMEEGTIDSWLVEVGEEVEEGDPIVEIQTDKITMEVEAEADGVLLTQLFEAGETVPVQHTIAYIGEAGEEIPETDDAPTVEATATEEVEETKVEQEVTQATNNTGEKIRRTPIARRLAEENNVALQNVDGTGPLGRIQKVDVENYVAENKENITPLAKKIADDQQIDTANLAGSGVHGKIKKADVIGAQQGQPDAQAEAAERVPFKGMRKVIADNISNSFYTAPHVTLFSEIDMTEVVNVRKQLLPIIEEQEGVRVSFNEIIMKATAFSLRNNPEINVSLENGKEIVYHNDVNLGFAVAVDAGLVVPVLRNVDQKGLGILTKEAKTIAKKARDNMLTPDEMQGSTFTISNLGMFAVDGFTPIINQPNAAILGVGRIQEKPVIVDGEVKVRSMMSLSLSFDHRIIDGAPAAQFLTDLKNVLENPYKLMV
ncbi:MAG TPA: dihydrolipoamide acetyltransferase family protein [Pseudogracilibacillus sp.]|nr:dihydrolipoamide acetyltransferase family protein [Pseudogracilibacillus sp.]